MKFNQDDLDLAGKIIVNSLLMALLWAILALPATSFSLLKFKNDNQVLSAQDIRNESLGIEIIDHSTNKVYFTE